jgi:hypothetical protein
MQVNYTIEAFTSLSALVNFIEANNTPNAGLRWLNRFEDFLSTTLTNSDKITLCNNATFNRLSLRCVYFNDWVVAFSIHTDYILIEALLHKSRIID